MGVISHTALAFLVQINRGNDPTPFPGPFDATPTTDEPPEFTANIGGESKRTDETSRLSINKFSNTKPLVCCVYGFLSTLALIHTWCTLYTIGKGHWAFQLPLFITMVELVIKWNHISGVNHMGSTGQVFATCSFR